MHIATLGIAILAQLPNTQADAERLNQEWNVISHAPIISLAFVLLVLIVARLFVKYDSGRIVKIKQAEIDILKTEVTSLREENQRLKGNQSLQKPKLTDDQRGHILRHIAKFSAHYGNEQRLVHVDVGIGLSENEGIALEMRDLFKDSGWRAAFNWDPSAEEYKTGIWVLGPFADILSADIDSSQTIIKGAFGSAGLKAGFGKYPERMSAAFAVIKIGKLA